MNHTDLQNDTIVAPATPPGRGSVSIVRVSGPKAFEVLHSITGVKIQPRYARYLPFFDAKGEVIDRGIVIYFPGPDSFTGEDVLELHGHGGPVVNDMLIRTINQMGIRLARPGEFSERSFLNDKMDLSQAEAIADLIDSASEQAARSAIRSLQGVFSNKIHHLVESLIALRMYVEAAIDFPEEEIDFLAEGKVLEDLNSILKQLDSITKEARQGALLQQGMSVVIAGKPNAGKSSLLNALAGKETAIVTDIAGTTRDILRENINIDGMPLHIMDTAGLREARDQVEKIGVERALKAISEADMVLLVADGSQIPEVSPESFTQWSGTEIPACKHITLVKNKIDLTGEAPGKHQLPEGTLLQVCARTGEGMDILRQHLKSSMGFTGATENGFSARRRHIEALSQAQQSLLAGKEQFLQTGAGELLAEDLRMAQQSLGTITGSFSNDDLLGRIFSNFCIGK